MVELGFVFNFLLGFLKGVGDEMGFFVITGYLRIFFREESIVGYYGIL